MSSGARAGRRGDVGVAIDTRRAAALPRSGPHHQWVEREARFVHEAEIGSRSRDSKTLADTSDRKGTSFLRGLGPLNSFAGVEGRPQIVLG